VLDDDVAPVDPSDDDVIDSGAISPELHPIAAAIPINPIHAWRRNEVMSPPQSDWTGYVARVSPQWGWSAAPPGQLRWSAC
jgi:hypothetical protein